MLFVDQMEAVLKDMFDIASFVHYDFVNVDSGLNSPKPAFPGCESFKYIPGPQLAYAINELRTIKSSPELEILQYTNGVSCRALLETIRKSFLQRMPSIMGMEHSVETHSKY